MKGALAAVLCAMMPPFAASMFDSSGRKLLTRNVDPQEMRRDPRCDQMMAVFSTKLVESVRKFSLSFQFGGHDTPHLTISWVSSLPSAGSAQLAYGKCLLGLVFVSAETNTSRDDAAVLASRHIVAEYARKLGLVPHVELGEDPARPLAEIVGYGRYEDDVESWRTAASLSIAAAYFAHIRTSAENEKAGVPIRE